MSALALETRPLLSRERIHAVLDPGSVAVVLDADDTGVATGAGTVEGTPVLVFATEPGVQGGALGAAGCARIARVTADAVARRCPVIGIWQSGGARIGDGVASLDGMGAVFSAITTASGVVPQISVVLGPAAGGAAYGPALTDLIVLGPAARVFVTGPDIVRSVTGEQVDAAGLGGPQVHAERSGLAHLTADSDEAALQAARALVALLGRRHVPAPVDTTDLCVTDLIPASSRRAYDVLPLLERLLDGPGLHLQPRYARNVVTVLGRLDGRTVGVVANNPLRKGGCLDSASAEKAARFVRLCDGFGIPLLVVVDVPGYLPGSAQEWDGVVRRGAKLLHAFAAASVPRVTLVTRKAFGGAYIAMNSRSLGATAVYAWPDAELAVMGAEAAVSLVHRRALAAAADDDRPALLAQLAATQRATRHTVDAALASGGIDAVIRPAETRRVLAATFAAAAPGRGRHGNIPL